MNVVMPSDWGKYFVYRVSDFSSHSPGKLLSGKDGFSDGRCDNVWDFRGMVCQNAATVPEERTHIYAEQYASELNTSRIYTCICIIRDDWVPPGEESDSRRKTQTHEAQMYRTVTRLLYNLLEVEVARSSKGTSLDR